tara:strand:- start:319 stop:699 length:381 start_codon:yes stop_codon:yes gene_type:complete
MTDKLTGKQKTFCLEYIKTNCSNGTAAAIKAGYSKKTAAVIANENLKKPNIKKFIDSYRVKTLEKFEVNQKNWLEAVAALSFDDTNKVSIKDKLKALDMLGKFLGAYNNDESGKALINVIMGVKNK